MHVVQRFIHHYLGAVLDPRLEQHSRQRHELRGRSLMVSNSDNGIDHNIGPLHQACRLQAREIDDELEIIVVAVKIPV